MRKIYKYDLNYHSVPELVRLPVGAEIIDFQIQNDAFKLWALVDPKAKEEKRVFVIAMTGQEIPWKVEKSFGTRIIESTGIVVHLFELKEVKDGKDPLLANDPLKDDRLNKN